MSLDVLAQVASETLENEPQSPQKIVPQKVSGNVKTFTLDLHFVFLFFPYKTKEVIYWILIFLKMKGCLGKVLQNEKYLEIQRKT